MIHWKRLVAQGYLQAEGFDVTETFAPTVRLTTIRLVLGFATHRRWKIFQMDVKSAFLNGKIKVMLLNLPVLSYQTQKTRYAS